MRDFKKPGSFGKNRNGNNFDRSNTGRQDFSADRRSGQGRDDGFRRSQMFEAICANCGKRCEVPFRPSGQRPVYCRDCFGKQDHVQSGNFPRKDFGARTSFRASPARGEVRDGRIDDIKKQLDVVNAKLDQLLGTSREIPLQTSKPLVTEVEGVKKARLSKDSKKKISPKKR